ncbi:CAP domain-containing protein [Rubinisphaera italica]|uniref:Cysteine-rich secretory protein family protein n=1 Tax=Rubinisphaera italica TaxID=2527969 RepID=A0A5C5XJD0_9PLAN|nr:CAP domain-containing protein [Rubinisphaera italica]TWT61882.1 Cysteine-rich secretory protein family protein [Rubinisphaera italica]
MNSPRTSFAIILACLIFSPNIASPREVPEKPAKMHDVEMLLIDKTNEYRKSNQLKLLSSNNKLNQAARNHANVMIETNNFSHQAGDTQPSDRAEQAGYRWYFIAENIAWRSGDNLMSNEQLADAILQQWINSPGHNQNLLAKLALECGVSITYDANSGRTYIVMLYARPRN